MYNWNLFEFKGRWVELILLIYFDVLLQSIIMESESPSPSFNRRYMKRCVKLRLYINKIIKPKYFRYNLKRLMSDRFTKNILLTAMLLMCTIFWVICVKIPQDKANKSQKVTEIISKTLGTRITAVRVKPDMNTTLLQPSTDCDAETFAVILIKSVPQNIQPRDVLRNTWFQFLPKLDVKVKAFFFIGLPAHHQDMTSLQQEASVKKDLIIEDLEENFYLLGLKALRMLKWFTNNCPKAKYLIKTDDDMFLNVPNIISHINSVPQAWVNFVGGQLHLSDQVDRNPDSIFYAPKDWWPEQEYPPFVTGGLIVMSSESLSFMINASLTIPLYHLEDIFLTGIIGFDNLHFVPSHIPGIESNNPKWITKLKMVISFKDLVKTNIAFHCPRDPEFIKELYDQVIR